MCVSGGEETDITRLRGCVCVSGGNRPGAASGPETRTL